MNKPLLTILAVSAATLGTAACSTWDSPTNKPPGTYKSTSESTNARGTTTKTDKTTYVYEDPSGNKKAVEKTETSTDPKGLFNKQTTTTTKSYN
jgi:hypothetical protein